MTIDEETTFKEKGYRSTDLSKGSGKSVLRVCDVCGERKWVRYASYVLQLKKDLCRSCARKGMVLSDEHKKAISLSHIGNPGYWTGKKRDEETIEKMAASKRGKKQSIETIKKRIKRGKDHYNWQGGITPDTRKRTRGIMWRRIADEIRERDNNTCQVCGYVGNDKKLPVHHIIPFRVSKNNSPENLVTVCQSCHIKLDHEYTTTHLLAERGLFQHQKQSTLQQHTQEQQTKAFSQRRYKT